MNQSNHENKDDGDDDGLIIALSFVVIFRNCDGI